jgi:hypothetical protein
VPEDIPGADNVSRHLFAPSMGCPGGDLIWVNVFMFKTERSYRESVVWRRYAVDIAEVHALGCAKQVADRDAGKKDCAYFGALTGNVDELRSIKSKNGAGLQVLHVPAEGFHHAEISYLHDRELTKNDKAELKDGIKKKFLARADHRCP